MERYYNRRLGQLCPSCCRLAPKQITWQKAQQNGIKLLKTFYDKEVLQKQLKERLHQLRKALEAHREQNFIGKLLQHQTMTSTKYMAKWIEEKNRG